MVINETNREKFIFYTVDEDTKRIIPVDCIGSIVVVKSMDRKNGNDIFGLMLGNKFGAGEALMTFPTQTQRDEKLQEVLNKISAR